MIKTIVSTFVPHEVDIVFQHISDFKNMVEYNSSVLKSEIISASSILPCYKIEVDMGIKKFTGEYKVLEIIKNNNLAFRTPEHFLPILYILGANHEEDEIIVFNDKCIMGSLSMTSYLIK